MQVVVSCFQKTTKNQIILTPFHGTVVQRVNVSRIGVERTIVRAYLTTPAELLVSMFGSTMA